MITLFEKFISQYCSGDDIKCISDTIGITPEQYKEVIDKVAEWYYDEYHITFLGSGAYGSAFRVNNEKNRVLKITTDENEAANISYLVKKSGVKGIVEYYDIHQVDIYKDGRLKTNVFSILMEKLYSISDMERDLYIKILQSYFVNKSGKLNLYVDVSRSSIECSWNEFKALNPIDLMDKFIEKDVYQDQWSDLKKYDMDEVKRLAKIYYGDIMGLVQSAIKYDLVLCDIHGDNIRKTEDEHMLVIDVGGYTTSSKTFRTKSKRIRIDLDNE